MNSPFLRQVRYVFEWYSTTNKIKLFFTGNMTLHYIRRVISHDITLHTSCDFT